MNDLESILSTVYERERRDAGCLHMTQPTTGDSLEVYTWERTMSEARRVAAYLRSLNFPGGSHIALVSKNCAEFVIADLAIWMAGHVSVALFPTLSSKLLAFTLDHSEARLIFVGKLDDATAVEQSIPEALPRVSFSLASPAVSGKPWRDILAEHAPIADSPTRADTDVAMLVYTSGSTGRPKAAIHSFGGLAAAGHGIRRALDVTASDRMLSYLPLAHVMERTCCEAVSLLSGMQLFFVASAATFVKDLKRARPTLFLSVPRLWFKFKLGVVQKLRPFRLEHLLQIPLLNRLIQRRVLRGLGLDHVRVAGSGSAPLPEDLIRWYGSVGLELREAYGMTENLGYSHFARSGETRVGYVGHPHDQVQCRISAAGEVLVKSPANLLGYFKEPEMSRESFTADGFFRTGDRGAIDPDGRLEITGRLKDLFKTSKGEYVAPAPIENLINAQAGIELSCVLGSGQRAPCAVIHLADSVSARPRPRLECELEALRSRVNAQVERHEQLQFLIVAKRPWTIETGELTPTMKIRRDTIEQAVSPHLDSWYRAGAGVILE